jgi:hypothetical protein
MTLVAPTQPRAETPPNARVCEPSAAPSENPRYMKEPFEGEDDRRVLQAGDADQACLLRWEKSPGRHARPPPQREWAGARSKAWRMRPIRTKSVT